MPKRMSVDKFLTVAASRDTSQNMRAPSRLKSRVYSRLMLEQASQEPIQSLTRTKHEECRGLCVFEELVQIVPIGEPAKSVNYCRVCHARILAEHLENPPIWWPNCPYADFRKG